MGVVTVDLYFFPALNCVLGCVVLLQKTVVKLYVEDSYYPCKAGLELVL